MDKYNVLNKYFGYLNFRGIQEECIDSILEGNDTICIMATGGGKSITFQVPGLMFDGLTLIISPLISLMNDQVLNLRKKGISAYAIHSNISYSEEVKIEEEIKNNNLKFLYISPERLLNLKFRKIIKDIKISLLIIDEAHCISMWGNDFRQSYKNIKEFKEELNIKTCAAFTATANKKVIDDIKLYLGLKNPNLYKSSFDRPNLYYEVIKTSDKFNELLNYLKHSEGKGIIYTLTRKRCEELYNKLKGKFKVSYYHGGLDSLVKKENQDMFLNGESDIMISTSSFGMGVDGVFRYVINYDLPMSIYDLTQQQGRAGRDLKFSKCLLLYDPSDTKINEYFIDSLDDLDLDSDEIKRLKKIKRENLNSVISYAKHKGCLHEYLVSYFGEAIPSHCEMCSNCKKGYKILNAYEESIKIIKLISDTKERFTMSVIADTLSGERTKAIKMYHLNYQRLYNSSKKDSSIIKEIITRLINDGYLSKSCDEFPRLKLNQNTNSFFKLDKYLIKYNI